MWNDHVSFSFPIAAPCVRNPIHSFTQSCRSYFSPPGQRAKCINIMHHFHFSIVGNPRVILIDSLFGEKACELKPMVCDDGRYMAGILPIRRKTPNNQSIYRQSQKALEQQDRSKVILIYVQNLHTFIVFREGSLKNQNALI